MFVGTLVSLFIIPLIYWFIYMNKEVVKVVKLNSLEEYDEKDKSYTIIGIGNAFRLFPAKDYIGPATDDCHGHDSSLEAFRTKNMYLSGYWEYRTFKANRLPSLTLNMTPAQYNRDITKRYDSEQGPGYLS